MKAKISYNTSGIVIERAHKKENKSFTLIHSTGLYTYMGISSANRFENRNAEKSLKEGT